MICENSTTMTPRVFFNIPCWVLCYLGAMKSLGIITENTYVTHEIQMLHSLWEILEGLTYQRQAKRNFWYTSEMTVQLINFIRLFCLVGSFCDHENHLSEFLPFQAF